MAENRNDIYLDGQLFTPFAEGIDEIVAGYEETENLIGYGVSSTIVFMKDAYDYLFGVFFADACDGRNAEVDVTLIMRSCCTSPVTFTFKINFESVELSELDCKMYVELIAENECQQNYEYLRDTPFFDDGYANDVTHGMMDYCVQPKNFFVFLQLFQMIWILLFALQVIETIFETLVGWLIDFIIWLDILPKALADALDEFNQGLDLIPSLDNAIAVLTGCGNFHYTSGIKELIDYNVSKSNDVGGCVITLDAPFLDAKPYSELALINCNVKKGISCELKGSNFHTGKFHSRAYNRTTLQLLNEIAEVFAMRVIVLPNGTLKIDQYENLVNSAPVIANLETLYLKGGAEEPPRYKFVVGDYYASTKYSYSNDGHDTEGNLLLRGTELNSKPISAQYSDIVKWDEDGSTAKNAVQTKTFKFGALRGISDIETAVQDGFFDVQATIDFIRSGQTTSIFGMGTIIPAFILDWTSGLACLPIKSAPILGDHACEYPKLVVLEDVDEKQNPKVVNEIIDDLNGSRRYNSPMHLDNNAQYPELIQSFHEIVDNPESLFHRSIIIEQYTVKATSDMMNSVILYGTWVGLTTRYGRGIPESIDIDFKNCTITFKNIKLKCQRIVP